MRIISTLMGRGFKKQTKELMTNFKQFAEERA